MNQHTKELVKVKKKLAVESERFNTQLFNRQGIEYCVANSNIWLKYLQVFLSIFSPMYTYMIHWQAVNQNISLSTLFSWKTMLSGLWFLWQHPSALIHLDLPTPLERLSGNKPHKYCYFKVHKTQWIKMQSNFASLSFHEHFKWGYWLYWSW